MSTLLGENILQLANRLQQKQQMLYGDSPSSSSPPPSTSLDHLFPIKEEIRDEDPTTPPPSQSQSDSEPSPPLVQQQQSTLLSALSAMNSASPQLNDAPGGQSPWMRNAGRKKSHPVWEFFRDLKLENGSSSVLCLHCGWTGEDRSPNNLRTHLKKSHSHDGVFQKFSEKLANTPTQPYVKRVRAGGILHSSQSAVQQLQHTLQQLPGSDVINIDEMMSNFLDSIPKMEEVINITASFSTPADHDDNDMNGDSHELVNSRSSSSPSTSDPAPPSSPALSVNNHQGGPAIVAVNGVPAVTTTTTTVPSLAGLNSMMMASNPLLFMSALANASNGTTPTVSSSSSSSISSTPPFFLTDVSCVTILMKMAVDLDLTFSYHKRRGEVEITFESNRTAEKSGGRGKIVALSDIGKDIRVSERVNGSNTESELWTKTDVQQFQWAIRGKCTKLLK
ncbi:bed-2 [Pristionchus pacificus]|uniref:Bed-2 n=1 Tax=Pristionchus pacificus TaxID=54126 RepID=A0A454XP83_PRIPA|nr:bed-2 [Pristionchus pacificus]|eukprot:PDM67757.1 bed-2 [Pristionchus pacificus]